MRNIFAVVNRRK